MQISIKTSKTMDKEAVRNWSYENRVIRMSAACRKKYDLNLYDFITLKSHKEELLTLQIVEAYKEDILINHMVAFVTAKIYDSLYITDIEFQEVYTVEGITLGCDPELYLIDKITGNIVGANRFVKKYGDVGYDGLLMELRPMPSTEVKGLTTNLYNLLLQARKMLNNSVEGQQSLMVGASCYKNGITAGFHLHYGLPTVLLSKNYNVEAIAQLMVMVLDYYVGLPSIIAEGKDDVLRRTIPYVKYGKPGGYVLDNRTLEYRLPGGYMLRHPILTEGLIALGVTVVEDIVSRINICTDYFVNLDELKTLKDIYQLYPNLPTIESLYHFICNIDDTPARNQLTSIITDVRQMVGYNKRSSCIEALFSTFLENIKFNSNIEKNWRNYTDEKQPKQMDLFSFSN